MYFKTDPKMVLICNKVGNEYSAIICSLLLLKAMVRDKHIMPTSARAEN